MENHLKFTQPSPIIYDIHGNVLLHSSSKITESFIRKLVKNSSSSSTKVCLGQTNIIHDFSGLLENNDQSNIFSDIYKNRNILEVLKNTTLNTNVIEELENIKHIQPLTYTHILNVSALAIKISIDLQSDYKYDPMHIAQITLSHDLGKSRIPINILEKSTPLTNHEFKMIQSHPVIEYLLLCNYLKDSDSLIAQATFAHHERLDGTGYPRGITNIDKYTQAIIPCDIFDALVSNRPYRNEGFSTRAAIDVLLEEVRKGKINSEFVYCLLSYCRKDNPYYKDIIVSSEKRDLPPKVNYYGIRAD